MVLFGIYWGNRMTSIGEGPGKTEPAALHRPVVEVATSTSGELVEEQEMNQQQQELLLKASNKPAGVANSTDGAVRSQDEPGEPGTSAVKPEPTERLVMKQKTILFDHTYCGYKSKQLLVLENPSKQVLQVSFEVSSPQFSVRHTNYSIRPGRFIGMPVYFHPQEPGSHMTTLTVTATRPGLCESLNMDLCGVSAG